MASLCTRIIPLAKINSVRQKEIEMKMERIVCLAESFDSIDSIDYTDGQLLSWYLVIVPTDVQSLSNGFTRILMRVSLNFSHLVRSELLSFYRNEAKAYQAKAIWKWMSNIEFIWHVAGWI